VPGARDPFGGHRVRQFVENPNVTDARSLIESGALWNMFIIVAAIRRLIDLFRPQWRALIAEMQVLVAGDQSAGCEDIRGLHLAEAGIALEAVERWP
jgi:mannose-1-phosphate guanylyltransferase